MIIQVSLFATCLATCLSFIDGAFGFGNKDKILLSDVQALTLRHGQMTTARRSSPVPQLKCVGGTAGCTSFVPQVVQCINRGSDGYDIQWECKTDMDNAYRFGRVEVTCEGYDYPDDANILKGSCGLEYTLDLTEEGLKRRQGSQHDYYGNQHGGYQNVYDNDYHDRSGYQTSYKVKTKASSVIGDLILLCIVGGIIYALYKTCIANNTAYPGADDRYRNRHDNSSDRPPPYNERPPPYGFRSDYMPDDGPSCSSSHTRSNAYTGTQTGGSTGGGFWTGAMTGGILGYMFGNRNSNYGSRTYSSPYSGGWFGSRSYGSRTYSTPSHSFGSGGSWSSGSSGSSGTRTASGFGGTKRR